MSPSVTAMPKMSTGWPKSTTCTQAWLGDSVAARHWNFGCMASRSRMDPLVTAPMQPSPTWTVVFTSPQNAPSPGWLSTSWTTVTHGPGFFARCS
ncbi:MAG: hypothetical protein U1F52_04560 [Burkholderiales bacterium]